MNIGDVCTREVVTADRKNTLQEAASLMREQHVGSLVIIENSAQGQQAIGIVTDRDMVVDAIARGLDATTEIGQLAGGKLAVVPAHCTIEDAIATMRKRGVRRLLVSDAGELRGIVALDDLLAALARDMSDLAQTVKGGIDREAALRAPRTAQPRRTIRIPPQLIA